jgi:hypothetical protein
MIVSSSPVGLQIAPSLVIFFFGFNNPQGWTSTLPLQDPQCSLHHQVDVVGDCPLRFLWIKTCPISHKCNSKKENFTRFFDMNFVKTNYVPYLPGCLASSCQPKHVNNITTRQGRGDPWPKLRVIVRSVMLM